MKGHVYRKRAFSMQCYILRNWQQNMTNCEHWRGYPNDRFEHITLWRKWKGKERKATWKEHAKKAKWKQHERNMKAMHAQLKEHEMKWMQSEKTIKGTCMQKDNDRKGMQHERTMKGNDRNMTGKRKELNATWKENDKKSQLDEVSNFLSYICWPPALIKHERNKM